MVANLVLLVLVLAVAAGLVTATTTAFRVHSYPTAFTRWFLGNILLFNLLILLGLVFHYMRIHVPGEAGTVRGINLILLVTVMAAFKLGWLYAFVGMNRALLNEELPGGHGRGRAVVAGLLLLAAYGALLLVGAASARAMLVGVTALVFDAVVVGAALVSSGLLLLTVAGLPASPRRRSLFFFGIFHLLLLVALLGFTTLAWMRDRDPALFNGLLLIAYNLVPLAWLARFQPMGPDALADGGTRYGITAREREVIELIAAGQTNQEIADRLCISLATVKDHNHNIFRKTGVRNRLELAILFGRHSASGTRGDGQE